MGRPGTRDGHAIAVHVEEPSPIDLGEPGPSQRRAAPYGAGAAPYGAGAAPYGAGAAPYGAGAAPGGGARRRHGEIATPSLAIACTEPRSAAIQRKAPGWKDLGPGEARIGWSRRRSTR